MMMELVLKLGVNDDEEKNKAIDTVSGLSGVDSISMDMNDKKLTVIGDIDPGKIVIELRKLCHTEIVSFSPAKKPEKAMEMLLPEEEEMMADWEEEEEEEEGPPPATKKEPKIEEPKKDEPKTDDVSDLVKAYKA